MDELAEFNRYLEHLGRRGWATKTDKPGCEAAPAR